jgi:hypothetical protein
MIVVLLNSYRSPGPFCLAEVYPVQPFCKLSPVLVLLALLVGLFIPMGRGAPSGSATVLRNSVQIVPSTGQRCRPVPRPSSTRSGRRREL